MIKYLKILSYYHALHFRYYIFMVSMHISDDFPDSNDLDICHQNHSPEKKKDSSHRSLSVKKLLTIKD